MLYGSDAATPQVTITRAFWTVRSPSSYDESSVTINDVRWRYANTAVWERWRRRLLIDVVECAMIAVYRTSWRILSACCDSQATSGSVFYLGSFSMYADDGTPAMTTCVNRMPTRTA